jgi:antagonist of KipI
VSIAGAMDKVAHRIANAIVGNESSAAALEVTVNGPELRCLQDVVVAIAGADLQPRVDALAVPLHEPVIVRAGATLAFGARRSGARASVAFAGGIEVQPVLGSRATHAPSALGGFDGRALRGGDRLSLLPRGPMPSRRAVTTPVRLVSGGATLRVLRGPQSDEFGSDALSVLLANRFVVSADANRMGYRLTGRTVPAPPGDAISDVTFPGAIQVPPSGAPILLMADRAPTGGYPQLAVVISADLPLAGQLAPGDWVEFELTTREAAVAELTAQERVLQHLEGHAFA